MILFIDNLSAGSYLPIIVDGMRLPKRIPKTANNNIDYNRSESRKSRPMISSLKLVFQMSVSLALTGALGLLLFGVTDLATQGVIA